MGIKIHGKEQCHSWIVRHHSKRFAQGIIKACSESVHTIVKNKMTVLSSIVEFLQHYNKVSSIMRQNVEQCIIAPGPYRVMPKFKGSDLCLLNSLAQKINQAQAIIEETSRPLGSPSGGGTLWETRVIRAKKPKKRI